MKIENTKYERDLDSKAVLNTNRNALENYRAAKKQKEDEIAIINNMKSEIAELKQLVKKLLEK
ncbi:MAG: hypothetical protein QGH83_01150 [Candidatus Pacebacteria bacterium]|jgi:hypothetical protein|nr:hypothetical protein [Candidatus Paceibacterota bacterium]